MDENTQNQNVNENQNGAPAAPPPPPPAPKPHQSFVYSPPPTPHGSGWVSPSLLQRRAEKSAVLEQANSKKSLFMAVLSLVWGVFFADILLRGGLGFSVPLVAAPFFAIAIWFMKSKTARLNKRALWLLLPIGMLVCGFALQDSAYTRFINMVLLCLLVPVFMLKLTTPGKLLSRYVPFQAASAAVARPLGHLASLFVIFRSQKGQNKKNTSLSMVLLGLLLALPLCVVFILLFIQADSEFRYIINDFWSNLDLDIGSLLFDLFFGMLAALLLAAWLITQKSCGLPVEKPFNPASLNSLLASTVLTVLNLVMLGFVAVQFSYLFSGGALPSGMSYAEYARSGFFELVTVLFLSVVIVLLSALLVKKTEKGHLPLPLRILLSLFILCNFVVAGSALYRMFMYIDAYDLSTARLLATWLIALFALGLLGVALRLWIKKFRLLAYLVAVVLLLAGVINAVNMNSVVANYNVDRYLQSLGTENVRTIDVAYLGELGPAAAPATLRLNKEGKVIVRIAARAALNKQKAALDEKTWKNYCLTDILSQNALWYGEWS